MKPEKLAQKLFTILSYVIKKEMHPKNTMTFFSEIDCTRIEELRLQCLEAHGIKPSYTAFIAQAVALAVKEHPYVNARIFPSLFGSSIQRFKDIDIAVANEKDFIGAEFFAFLDVVRHVDQMSIQEIHQKLYTLARSDETNNDQLKAMLSLAKNYPTWLGKRLAILPTFSFKLWERFRGAGIIISSPAKYGVDIVSATWAHPIGVSFGLVKLKPMIKDGKAEPVLSFTLTLNVDRRIISEATAARFLNDITQHLTRPITTLKAYKIKEAQHVA